MKIKKLLILFCLCFLACNNAKLENQAKQEKFDKVKWATKDKMDYPYRDNMLNDVMSHYELHGLKKDSLINLFGSPDRSDSSYLFYTIAQERLGFFPIHTKTLVIKLTKDKTVEWRKIHE